MFIAAEKGDSRNFRNFSGIVNRVTGDLEAIAMVKTDDALSETHYSLKCRPTQQLPNAVSVWRDQIVTTLQRNKRYPVEAQGRREQGVVQVFFSIDRQGRLTESRVTQSSEIPILDEEALSLLSRSQPFALASCKEPSSLLRVFGFNTPLLGACDEHRCVENFSAAHRLPCTRTVYAAFAWG
jgi:TonB family protein